MNERSVNAVRRLPSKARKTLDAQMNKLRAELLQKSIKKAQKSVSDEIGLRTDLVEAFLEVLEKRKLLPTRKCIKGGNARLIERLVTCVDALLTEIRT